MQNIEYTIIASLLYNEQEAKVDSKLFNHPFTRKLVNGYNRMLELGEPIDFELLRNKFIKANKWTMQEDNMLLDLMSNTTPFSSKSLFNGYYNVLKKHYNETSDRRFAI